VRERPWRVTKVQAISDPHLILELDALDGEEPRRLSVVAPPEEPLALPPEGIQFDPSGFDSLRSWTLNHRIIDATLVRETGLISGARFGRVSLEAYQLAPAMRLLASPRPSLLVADDVGLGKTIEAGLAMLELMARGRLRRVLIVTPPGLLEQWRAELEEKFALKFTIIENAAGLSRVQTELPAGTSPWDVLPRILTSVDFIKKETVRARALRKRWDLVIVDEAHALAESGTPDNPYRTQRTRLGTALRDASRGLLLLTATPHNGYSHSFRSLLELVDPNIALSQGTREAVVRRIERARIRRMKAQIRRRLPDGREEDVFPQRHVSGMAVALTDARERELLHKVATYCSRTAREAEGDEADLISFAMQIIKKRALSSRAALKKTIQHRLDALRREEHREAPPDRSEIRDLQAQLPLGEAAAERTAERIVRSAIPREERRRKNEVRALNAIRRILDGLPDRDPKVEALLAEINAVLVQEPNEKLIVFTEYLDTLDAIKERIDSEGALAGRYVVLHGGLGLKRRLQRQATFEEPGTRILLATDAASEGLNLQTHCRRVIHVELPWNPNRLEQRNGRVDRYGQKRNPEIRYLYYPDSPEDDVLNALVTKIEQIRTDRLSTPDILGVLAGDGEVEKGLVELDPEADDIECRKSALVQHFEDRTADYVRNVQPLVAASDPAFDQERLLRLLDTAESLLADDQAFERLVLDALGSAVTPHPTIDGVFRINTPLVYRGPGVAPAYPAATFRRSVAVSTKANEVEFITPLHPLSTAMAAEARRRLVQVFAGERGLPARRLAARPVSAGERPSVVFTFLATIQGGAGLLEEHILPVRVDVGGQIVGVPNENRRWIHEDCAVGDVTTDLFDPVFQERFDAVAHTAGEEAARLIAERLTLLRSQRSAQANLLRQDLETDFADRLREIDEEQSRTRGLVEDTGQRRLFGSEETRPRAFDARREAVRGQRDARLEDLETFARIDDPPPPRPMGALLLVPEGGR
jgi:superfamily II DNA or RNA helicase